MLEPRVPKYLSAEQYAKQSGMRCGRGKTSM